MAALPVLRWAPVGPGRLALTHRPKLAGMSRLRAEGCDRLMTLLSAREGAERIGEQAQAAQLAWTWLPLDSGRPAALTGSQQHIIVGLIALAAQLNRGESVAIHCSAGIHRTGAIAYAFLRAYGYTRQQALDTISHMRVVTRSGLTEAHLAFGDAVALHMREASHEGAL